MVGAMPQYHQYPNACGLTALLMALRPEDEGRGLVETFNLIWDAIAPLFHGKASARGRAEYRWQRALEYLNILCLLGDPLPSVLDHDLGELYENFTAFETFQLHQVFGEKSRSGGTASGNSSWDEQIPFSVDADLIMRRVYTMKHDIELKILAHIFGCTFVPWPASRDGTGAVFFTGGDFPHGQAGPAGDRGPEKQAFLTEALEEGHPVLCGSSYHWLAVRELITNGEAAPGKLGYNDPMGGQGTWRLRSLGRNQRFYRFAFDPARRDKYAPLVARALSKKFPDAL